MKRNIVKKAALHEKSAETGIPFSNLLAGYVLEQLLYLISESDFAQFLWLKNDEAIGIGQYRTKNILSLEYAYLADASAEKKGAAAPGQELSLRTGYIMLAHILKKEKVPEIKWRAGASFADGKLLIRIRGEFEEMTVPIQLRICAADSDLLLPVRKEFSFLMQPEKSVPYLKYPAETALAEQLMQMIRQMELISDMKPYDVVYRILSQEPIDGRHIAEMLAESCRASQIALETRRGEEIVSYRNYAYMRRRWEKYARNQKGEKPSWEEVMDIVGAFLSAVWTAVCGNVVFLGDWMPELGRFLD